MTKWAKNNLNLLSEESWSRFVAISKDDRKLDDLVELRAALLDFIADFANWDNSTVPEYLAISRLLTQAAYESLGGEPGSRPLVVDPFAGGGAIPLEALRVGASAFASDLNPVAVLLNKVLLEYIPKYGQKLADEVRKLGQWIKEQSAKELAEYYPKDPDGAVPIAYLWARTIQCEGPGCGAEVPLMRSLWLAKKGSNSVALRMIPRKNAKRVDFEIIEKVKAKDVANGTVARSKATCPLCGYTTLSQSVKRQLKERNGGVTDTRLLAVVTTYPGHKGRFYRLSTERDLSATRRAMEALKQRDKEHKKELTLVPDEPLPLMSGVFNVPLYGHDRWGSMFTPRQALLLTTFARHVARIDVQEQNDPDFKKAIKTLVGFAVDRLADYSSAICTWVQSGEFIGHTFAQGQSLPIKFDFTEGSPLEECSGNWSGAIEWICKVIEKMLGCKLFNWNF